MINRVLRAFFILITIVALIVGGSSIVLARQFTQAINAQAEAGEVVEFEVPEGSTVTDVANYLRDDGLISQPFLFRLLVSQQGADDELQAGTYRLRTDMTMSEIIAILRQPRGGEGGEEVEFTIIPGTRLEQVAQVMVDAGLAPSTDAFLEVARDVEQFKERHQLLESIPAGQSLEGYLYPNTYRVFETSTISEVIDTVLYNGFEPAYIEFQDEITARTGEGDTPSVHQIVTMASIIQREAANIEEMPHLAHIFWNRLTPEAAAEVANRLQADPTVQYALGDMDDPWPNLDERLTREEIDNYDSPYNTYKNAGLPPGPIANPGAEALKAAAQPAAQRPDGSDGEDDLYFVLACSEERAHNFAATNDEFNILVAEYRNCDSNN
jgi:UPF0755 protein